MNTDSVKPILKWVGGKTIILDKIFNYFPKEIDNYYEFFIGGGSVFINLLKLLENKKIKLNGKLFLNDKNQKLINTYQQIKNNKNNLIKMLKKLKKEYQEEKNKKELYYKKRDIFNKTNNKLISACLMILLNKTGFRGLYRVNSKNIFNVPFGNYKNPSIFDENNINNLNKLFNKYDINFSSKSFEEIKLNNLTKKDFFYFDSPYYPLNKNYFTNYQKNGFNKHDELVIICNNLNKNNIKFIQSNSYCQYIVDNYYKYKKIMLLVKRRINSKNPNDKDIEFLIIN